ncbi:hypothetical protein LguiA_020359 [Lonicera macranthoides]
MLKILNKNLKCLCFKLRWPTRRRSKSKVVIKKFRRSNSKAHPHPIDSSIHPNPQLGISKTANPIRIATFNAALFSMAPAIPAKSPNSEDFTNLNHSFDFNSRTKSTNDRPKSILKQSPMHPRAIENLPNQQKFAKSKLRVSINLPDNEISMKRRGKLSLIEDETECSVYCSSCNSKSKIVKGKAQLKSTISLQLNEIDGGSYRSRRTVVELLRELDADILALQDVKAEEEKEMKPLSDLAVALGMNYVFAESWAPEYGNAIFSKWPIKRWKVHKIFEDTDYRNILKATIDVPNFGEVDFHCTHLDHLDENWRMKQINSIIESNEGPHILAGGLNSLDETDYSPERWTDIVKYYEEMGKPTPKVEVMRFLKQKQYTDAKDFAGECESVVMIAKGQSVQGTCKYGTRVDYVLVSPDSPYKFVPGSYSVVSSKGTSDHHIVKVDLIKADSSAQQHVNRKQQLHHKQKVVKITNSSSKGIWRINTNRRER